MLATAMPGESHEAFVVAMKIIAMSLVMAVGYFTRRRGYLNAEVTPVLSRLCTDIALPALIFMQMVDRVNARDLELGWIVPVLAVAGISVGFTTGWASWRLFARRDQAPVFIFTSGMSNWIYLPLPIVASLYGDAGITTLFLCNVGIHVLFWTGGVAILHGGKVDRQAMLNVARNPGLIASFAGIAFALLRPEMGDFSHSMAGWGGQVLTDALGLVGQATVPLSLIVTGAQIAAAGMVRNRPGKAVAGIVLNRLVLAPAVALALLWTMAGLVPLSPQTLFVIAIVVVMPVSVTSTVITEKMNQDTALAAQAVLYTTLCSILSVPLMVMLARAIL